MVTSDDTQLRTFIAQGLVSEVLHAVKSGKEATVYCCRASSNAEYPLVAAKVYRQHRLFRNDSVYQDGRVIRDRRTRRAVARKSRFGRQAHDLLWAQREYEVLCRLHAVGADVPRPIAGPISANRDVTLARNAILMEFLGDENGPAQPLNRARLSNDEAHEIFARLIGNVELLLAQDLIHADLSPFNVLIWQKRPIVIDFPQAIDPIDNPNATFLLLRDMENLCSYFARYGIEADAHGMALDLWERFVHGNL